MNAPHPLAAHRLLFHEAPRQSLFAASLAISVGLHLAVLVGVRPEFPEASEAPPALTVVLAPLAEVVATAPRPVTPPRRDAPPRVAPPIAKPPVTSPPEPELKPDFKLVEPAQSVLPPAPAPAAEATPAPATQPASPALTAPTATATVARVAEAEFRAAYLQNTPPRYPASARRNGEQGTVHLRVLVTTDGRAKDVQIERSSGSKALDRAALEAVRGWRFIPARRGAEPIEKWVGIPIVYKLEGE